MKFYAIITTLFYVSATAAVTEANNTQLLRGPRSAAAAADASNNNSLLLHLHAANQTRAAADVSLEAATMATRLVADDNVSASQVRNAAENANGTAADSPAPIAALTCNETDALLQVKYNITEDAFYSLVRSKVTPFLNVQNNSLPYWSDDNTVWYNSSLSLTDYEACLPRDVCSRITVGGFPTDAYELSFDGKAVDIGDEILFNESVPATATGVGNCATPICNDTEALLEAQFWAFGIIDHPFRVEDKDGNTVLHGDTVFLDNKRYFNKTSVCLPKDNACSTFLIGGYYQSDYYEPWEEPFPAQPSYSLFFDGKLVHRSDSWLFDSVQFGDSCKPLCNEEDESLVEFFMYDESQKFFPLDVDVPKVAYEYEWDLSIVNQSSFVSVSSGVVPQGPGFSPLSHKIMCIPKGSCSSFYFSVPNVTNEKYRSLNPVYSLAMDNITYRKLSLYNQNQTTNMGSCTVGGLCDEQTQDLFHLELRTPAKYEDHYASSFPAASIRSSDMLWFFEPDYFGSTSLLLCFDYNNRAYDLNSSFGVIECVPKDVCDLSFSIYAASPVERYAVKQNGVQLDDTQESDGYYVTPFGQSCSSSNSSLSGGAIAGIVIACVVAVGAVVCGLVSYKRRQSQTSKEGDENPLHESLL